MSLAINWFGSYANYGHDNDRKFAAGYVFLLLSHLTEKAKVLKLLVSLTFMNIKLTSTTIVICVLTSDTKSLTKLTHKIYRIMEKCKQKAKINAGQRESTYKTG